MVPGKRTSVSMREKWAPLGSLCDPPKATWPPYAGKAQYSKGANDICCLQEREREKNFIFKISLIWNELFSVTLHTPKHSITVAIVRGARMFFLTRVLL